MPEPDPPSGALKIVVDASMPADEVHAHPSAFDRLQRAFMEAASWDWKLTVDGLNRQIPD